MILLDCRGSKGREWERGKARKDRAREARDGRVDSSALILTLLLPQGAHTSSVSVYVRNIKKRMGEY